jgi:glycosyltransferase involved in cell wall biosynthesis
MFRHAAGIIGVSHDSINYIRTLIDGRMPLMRWIPNGTDFEKFADRQVYGQLKRASICTPDERLILLPGILEFRKGGRVLLEALHILGRANLHVAFLGDGPAKDLLRDIAFTLHLDTQVHFLGHAEDPEIADWYLAADLIVLPSFREALPYVLLEAMVLGKPVLATPAGGVAELVENGVNGLLVPVGDVQALADGICRLVDDPDYAAALAQNGAREVRERWSRASMARETIDFYHHIILQSR